MISLSHRGGLALCTVAAAGTALGCDLELVEPRAEAFVADYLTAGEHVLVQQSGPAGRILAITLVWTPRLPQHLVGRCELIATGRVLFSPALDQRKG